MLQYRYLQQFGQKEGLVWWVCPVEAFSESDPGVVESWFEPANDKIYRQQSYYGNVKRVSREKRSEITQQLEQPVKEEVQ